MMSSVFVIHIAITWALIGLIWTVQVLNYPLLENVGEAQFGDYHDRHMARISWLVGPLMLGEIATAAGLLYLGERSSLFLLSLLALAVIWISTAVVQVPLHQKLVSGYDPVLIRRLVRTNGWRTLAWTSRGICLVALLIPRL